MEGGRRAPERVRGWGIGTEYDARAEARGSSPRRARPEVQSTQQTVSGASKNKVSLQFPRAEGSSGWPRIGLVAAQRAATQSGPIPAAPRPIVGSLTDPRTQAADAHLE